MQEKEVLALPDKQELNGLALGFGNIPSPSGSEEAAAGAVFDWLLTNGFHPSKREVAVGRFNVSADSG